MMGLGNGPYDIGLFSLRQRSTDPLWMGRAFAISMSINYTGFPIGAALAGPILSRSLSVPLVVAFAAVVASGICAGRLLQSSSKT